MDWLEITLDVDPSLIDSLSSKLIAAGFDKFIVEDELDFEQFLEKNRQYWDYVDQSLIEEKHGISRIKLYVPDDSDGIQQYIQIKKVAQNIAKISQNPIKSEDWENGYKQFYKPTEIGDTLLILPVWEPKPETNRHILRLDPGISFGTGGHATTRLCLQYLEKYTPPDCRVLDIGCGSGILTIAALLCGAKEAIGCDIDPLSKDIALGNAKENGFSQPTCKFIQGDILSDSSMRKQLSEFPFQLVLANIVADVIIPLSGFVRSFMSENSHFICSGIIDGRQHEVRDALKHNGLHVIDCQCEDGWWAFLCT